MTEFYLNGTIFEQKISNNDFFGDTLASIRNKYHSGQSIISSINVDGMELTQEDESILNKMPMSEIKKIEVFTQTPTEIAFETIENLIPFIFQIRQRVIETQTCESIEQLKPRLNQIIDALEVFIDANAAIKKTLKINFLQEIKVLETDLESILQDLLQSFDKNNLEHCKELMNVHLSQNLESWELEGLPAIMRSRVS